MNIVSRNNMAFKLDKYLNNYSSNAIISKKKDVNNNSGCIYFTLKINNFVGPNYITISPDANIDWKITTFDSNYSNYMAPNTYNSVDELIYVLNILNNIKNFKN